MTRFRLSHTQNAHLRTYTAELSAISAHSMEEAEALCDRVGIFVNGELQCIGNAKEVIYRVSTNSTPQSLLQYQSIPVHSECVDNVGWEIV